MPPRPTDLAEALPDARLRVQPVDGVGNVGRVALAREQAVRADLSLEVGQESPEGGCEPREQGPVAEAPVVGAGGEQLLALLPVRVRGRSRRQRGDQDRTRHRLEPVLAQHEGVVERLGEGELLVRVADAVAPGQLQPLDEQRAHRIPYATLGNRDPTVDARPVTPVRDDGGACRGVRIGAHRDRPSSGRPACVDGPGHAARNRYRERSDTDADGTARRRLDADVAREPPVGGARRERLLRVEAAGSIFVAREEDRQPPVREAGRTEPGEAGTEPLAAVRTHRDLDRLPRRLPGEDRAAVRDVQHHVGRPGRSPGHREGNVVHARSGEGAPLRSPCERDRREPTGGPCVCRPARRGEELLAPHVPCGAEGVVHAGRVGGRRAGNARRRIHRVPRGCRRDGQRGEDDERAEDARRHASIVPTRRGREYHRAP